MADTRMREYKNAGRDNAENRSRRVENNVELRKNKRTEQLQKRRHVCEDDEETAPASILGMSQAGNRDIVPLASLATIVQGKRPRQRRERGAKQRRGEGRRKKNERKGREEERERKGTKMNLRWQETRRK